MGTLSTCHIQGGFDVNLIQDWRCWPIIKIKSSITTKTNLKKKKKKKSAKLGWFKMSNLGHRS